MPELSVRIVDRPERSVYPDTIPKRSWKVIFAVAGICLGVIAISVGLVIQKEDELYFSKFDEDTSLYLQSVDATFTNIGNGFCRSSRGDKGLSYLACRNGCSLEECAQKCMDLPNDKCTGIEYSARAGRCETHYGDVSKIHETPGQQHTCFTYSPPTRPQNDECSAYDVKGRGFCRYSGDNVPIAEVCNWKSRCSYNECINRCNSNSNCKAIEFGYTSGRCELHLGGESSNYYLKSSGYHAQGHLCSLRRTIPGCGDNGGGGNGGGNGNLPIRNHVMTGYANMGTYVGKPNTYNINGRLKIQYDGSSTVRVTGNMNLENLDCTGGCGFHIHAGVSCQDVDGTGPHYYRQKPDPWMAVTYSGPNPGTSTVSVNAQASGFVTFSEIAGRTITLHAPNGDRIGCGEIKPEDIGENVLVSYLSQYPGYPVGTATATKFVKYPGYYGNLEVSGTATVKASGQGLQLDWDLSGLQGNHQNVAKVFVAEAKTCVENPGSPLYEGSSNPWDAVRYSTNSQGKSQGGYTLVTNGVPSLEEVIDHAFIIEDRNGNRIACATLSHVPDVTGFGMFYQTNNGLQVRAHLQGLEKIMTSNFQNTASGGVHIHTGRTCADAQGHLLLADGVTDPWKTTKYTVTSLELEEQGLARAVVEIEVGNQNIKDIEGRTFVMHASNGQRIACGTISTFGDSNGGSSCGDSCGGSSGDGLIELPFRNEVLSGFANMGTYVGKPNTYNINGRLKIQYDGSSTVRVTGNMNLENLDCTGGCGFHIHAGVSCQDVDGTGPHYYRQKPDPWMAVTYSGPNPGTSTVSVDAQASGFFTFSEIVGRTITLHAPNGERIGCGEIKPEDIGENVLISYVSQYPGYPVGTATATKFVKYPGYSGSLDVEGQVTVKAQGSGLKLDWELSGLEKYVYSGARMEIHDGMSCSQATGDAMYTGYWNPWGKVKYTTDSKGNATGSYNLLGSGVPNFDGVVNHALVVKSRYGKRIACATLAHTPNVTGSAMFFQTMEGLQIRGHFQGLEKISSSNFSKTAFGGVHVHTGTSCASAAGHLLLADGVTDPWKDLKYTVNSRELKEQNVARTVFEASIPQQNILDVQGRTLVIHASNGQRIACGSISQLV